MVASVETRMHEKTTRVAKSEENRDTDFMGGLSFIGYLIGD